MNPFRAVEQSDEPGVRYVLHDRTILMRTRAPMHAPGAPALPLPADTS
jgi:hypothetical protein